MSRANPVAATVAAAMACAAAGFGIAGCGGSTPTAKTCAEFGKLSDSDKAAFVRKIRKDAKNGTSEEEISDGNLLLTGFCGVSPPDAQLGPTIRTSPYLAKPK